VFNEESLEAGRASIPDEVLCRVQDELFDIGSELRHRRNFFKRACTKSATMKIKRLEKLIDQCQEDLEPLNRTSCRAAGRVGAYLHQSRTVCRRAEREILRLSRAEKSTHASSSTSIASAIFSLSFALDCQANRPDRVSVAAGTSTKTAKGLNQRTVI